MSSDKSPPTNDVQHFRVVLEIKPGVGIGRPYNIKLPQGEMFLQEILDSNTRKPVGLHVVVTILNSSFDKAVTAARGLTKGVMSLFSYMAFVGLPDPRVMKAYEITPGMTVGEFRQYHYDIPVETTSIRHIDRNQLKVALEAFNEELDSVRISRAVHWYRIGLLSTDVLDRYTALWTGLETLNPILRNRYGLEVEWSTCTNCGHKSTPIQNGVKRLVDEVSKEERIWKRLRRIRASILHGFRRFSEITPDAQELVPFLELALAKALDLILNQDDRELKNPVQLDHPHPIYSTVDVTVTGPDMGLLDEHIEPALDAHFSVAEITPERQTLSISRQQTLDERFNVTDIKHVIHAMEHVARKIEFSMPVPIEKQEEE